MKWEFVLHVLSRAKHIAGHTRIPNIIFQSFFFFFSVSGSYVSKNDTLVLMLDYDGTLAPLVAHPSLSKTDPEAEEALHSLNKLSNVHVAIISGRAAENAREKLQIDNITYAGNHGLEIIFHDKSRYHHAVSEQTKLNFEKMVTELETTVSVHRNPSLTASVSTHCDIVFISVGQQWCMDRKQTAFVNISLSQCTVQRTRCLQIESNKYNRIVRFYSESSPYGHRSQTTSSMEQR